MAQIGDATNMVTGLFYPRCADYTLLDAGLFENVCLCLNVDFVKAAFADFANSRNVVGI